MVKRATPLRKESQPIVDPLDRFGGHLVCALGSEREHGSNSARSAVNSSTRALIGLTNSTTASAVSFLRSP